ncbi:MAG: EamA family transporter RarD [Candidatus Aminicenantes bacterium]|nr:EamA family transporter RarD [Candidatus Aminicenantes bacterium]
MILDRRERIIGTWYAIAAFLSWGVLPVYWKALQQVPATEILPYRIIGSFLFLALFNRVKKRWPAVRKSYSSQSNRLSSLISAVFIGFNWFVFIWAVNAGHIVEISMGYYINPLLSVFLGILFLKERLNFWQTVALFLATFGVLFMTVQHGRVPWIALSLALSFGIYGLLRKTAQVGSVTGLTAETAVLSPFALVFLIVLWTQGGSSLGKASIPVHLLLFGAGIATAVPLVWFARGARRIPLSTVGFIQYLAPTLHLLLGVFLYREPFTSTHAVSFILIWIALLIYSVSKTRFLQSLHPGGLKKMSD